ncbi:hypothetical protein GF391_01370 [Candidatus Uhrbacteria bacterium]|nr:hypothetical protein [Candidatus Uhrbacteria bacterium]
MKKDILFIAATHGDEPIGVEVLRDLQVKGLSFDWIVGNQPALDKGVRFIDTDLNRSAPGDPKAKSFEKCRAAEIVQISKQYQYTIDIHGSSKETGIFILITNPTMDNIKLASMLDIERIVIWPSLTPDQKGPLSEYFICGLEIECGKKDDPKIKAQLEETLAKFLKRDRKAVANWREQLKEKQVFEMYGSLRRSKCDRAVKLEEFVKTKICGESFFPIFVGSYDYEDVLCYKLREFDLAQLISLE